MSPYRIPKGTAALLAKIPSIPALRQADVLTELSRLRTLVDRAPRAKFLSILKYTAYLVLLLNFGSLPGVWHIQVFWPIFLLKIKYWTACCKLVFASKKQRTLALATWGEDLSPVGASPFKVDTVCRRWAAIDDIDAFGHLSNSSYAKALDSVRVKAMVGWFPAWGRTGGQMALGATHFHFIREIPPLARYEIRLTIGSWDHKWVYVMARFVTRPSRSRATSCSLPPSTPTTPVDASARNGSADVERAVAAVLNQNGPGSPRRTPIFEPDGTILHCVSVSQMCFKRDRITTPPALAFACEGFTRPSEDAARPYSHANPPPNWIKSQSLRVPPHGNVDNFRAFLRGKWRDVPEGERWWEDALGGPIETKRRANLEVLESLKLGLEQTRTLY